MEFKDFIINLHDIVNYELISGVRATIDIDTVAFQ